MNISKAKKIILSASFAIFALFLVGINFAQASLICETNFTKNGWICDGSQGKSWCGNNTLDCNNEPTPGTNETIDCNTCSAVCVSGFQNCGSGCTNIPHAQIIAPNCSTYDFCTGLCNSCSVDWNSCSGGTCNIQTGTICTVNSKEGTYNGCNCICSSSGLACTAGDGREGRYDNSCVCNVDTPPALLNYSNNIYDLILNKNLTVFGVSNFNGNITTASTSVTNFWGDVIFNGKFCLGATCFSSANISQWNNDIGYLTTSTISSTTLNFSTTTINNLITNLSSSTLNFSTTTVNNLITNIYSTTSGVWILENNNLYTSSTVLKVGIGTTSPAGNLHVSKNQNDLTTLIVDNQNSGTVAGSRFELRNGATEADATKLLTMGTGFTTNGAYKQDGSLLESGANLSGGLSLLARGASADMRFYTGGYLDANQRMTILSSGFVGIGTTTPDSLLTVVGSSWPSATVRLSNGTNTASILKVENDNGAFAELDTAGSGSNIYGLAPGDSILWAKNNLQFGAGGARDARLSISSNGNVGIGTTTPANKLTVQGSMSVEGTNANDRIYTANGVRSLVLTGMPGSNLFNQGTLSINAWNAGASGRTLLGLGVADTQVFRVDVSGNTEIAGKVGIGTTTPSTALYVVGTTTATDFCTIGGKCLGSMSSGISGVQVVALTASSYTGLTASNTGYKGVDTLCNTASTGSHVCTTEEIMNYVRYASAIPAFLVGKYGWIVSGPPGFTVEANDCKGWSSNSSNAFGRLWNFGAGGPQGEGEMALCFQSYQFICCK